MTSRWLQLNAGKTELVWLGSAANLRMISTTNLTLSVSDDVITPVDVVHNIGVHLDAELTMKQHVNRVMGSCLFQLHQLSQIRRASGSKVSAFILSKLGYCNTASPSPVLFLISH